MVARHNKVHDEILYLSRQSLPSHCIRGKPFVYQGISRSEEEVHQGRGVMDTIGDVLICVLWESQTVSIIYVIFVDVNTDTYKHEPMGKLLARWYKKNKNKHSKNFHNKWKHFSTFFLSLDGMIEKESLLILTNLSQLMAEKLEEPIS